jgi:F-type H+-transporting ATPase subunit b
MQLVTPAIGLVFWMGLTFSILLFILRKFAWKPILNSISEREQTGHKEGMSSETRKTLVFLQEVEF